MLEGQLRIDFRDGAVRAGEPHSPGAVGQVPLLPDHAGGTRRDFRPVGVVNEHEMLEGQDMAVSPTFRTFVLEQLGRVMPGIRGRAMFGGVGIYAGDLFFALIADDTLYLKVDDTNREDFESRGLEPFRPYGSEGEVMHYYCAPDDLLDDAEALGEWARKAVAVARRAKGRPSRRGPA